MYEPLRYPTGEEFPFFAEVIGICLAACSIVVIPGYALYYVFNNNEDGLGPISVYYYYYYFFNFKNLKYFQRFRQGIRMPAELETGISENFDDLDDENSNVGAV
jgi:hypothetical protein